MLARELHQVLAAARASSAVLVFVRRPGALEPEVVEVSEVISVPTEDAFVLYVDIDD